MQEGVRPCLGVTGVATLSSASLLCVRSDVLREQT